MRYEMRDVAIGGGSISTLIAGREDREPVVLLHGLGATKASWLTVVPALSRRYRVLAIDLPGFGASSKPWGRYDAAWFSGQVFRLLDVLGYTSALVAGNSMGGKIATEMALLDPARVSAVACLCPATAFSQRPGLWLARALRPELGMLLGYLPRARLRHEMRRLFASPDAIEDVWYEAAIDDFAKTWRSPRARSAFFAAARKIYLEEPYGEGGFWNRFCLLEVPALFVFGEHDLLIRHEFAHKVTEHCPTAEVLVWPDCGHVPQIEHPDRCAETMLGFFDGATPREKAG